MDLVPESNASYRDASYWNERYETEDNYEWFKSYKDFMHLLKQNVKPDDNILMLGCGNSSLSEHMFEDGFRRIVNVDFSPVVLRKMALKAPTMEWITMDIRHLAFRENTFDVVIEKGTLDALVAGEDVWNVSQSARTMVSQTLDSVQHVLKGDGHFLSITFTQPHFRLPLLQRPSWQVKHHPFGQGFHYFYYVTSKINPSETNNS